MAGKLTTGKPMTGKPAIGKLTPDLAEGLVDRVAAVLHAEQRLRFPGNELADWDRTSRPWKGVWRMIARAALDAAHPGLVDGTHLVAPREPTTAMLDAGATQFLAGLDDYRSEGVSSSRPFARLYKAMLRAAEGGEALPDAPPSPEAPPSRTSGGDPAQDVRQAAPAPWPDATPIPAYWQAPPKGCICPPGANLECLAPDCPRRGPA